MSWWKIFDRGFRNTAMYGELRIEAESAMRPDEVWTLSSLLRTNIRLPYQERENMLLLRRCIDRELENLGRCYFNEELETLQVAIHHVECGNRREATAALLKLRQSLIQPESRERDLIAMQLLRPADQDERRRLHDLITLQLPP